MVLLIEHPADYASRKTRIIMNEKKMLFSVKSEEPWNLSANAIKLNPASQLPILVSDGSAICGNYALMEFLDAIRPEPKLIYGNIKQQAEIRRLTDWFDNKFYPEVCKPIVYEKVHKRFGLGKTPDSKILNAAAKNLSFHISYMEWVLEKSTFLGGETISMADISAAAAISLLDYLGEISWQECKTLKLWYAKIKSRPSFKELLKDNIKGILPSKHYANLDF